MSHESLSDLKAVSYFAFDREDDDAIDKDDDDNDEADSVPEAAEDEDTSTGCCEHGT